MTILMWWEQEGNAMTGVRMGISEKQSVYLATNQGLQNESVVKENSSGWKLNTLSVQEPMAEDAVVQRTRGKLFLVDHPVDERIPN